MSTSVDETLTEASTDTPQQRRELTREDVGGLFLRLSCLGADQSPTEDDRALIGVLIDRGWPDSVRVFMGIGPVTLEMITEIAAVIRNAKWAAGQAAVGRASLARLPTLQQMYARVEMDEAEFLHISAKFHAKKRTNTALGEAIVRLQQVTAHLENLGNSRHPIMALITGKQ